MNPTRKQCAYCGRWYEPDPHTARHQRACPRPECRRARRGEKQRLWRAQNPNYERSRGPKRAVWARDYPDYYRRYRARHPEYRVRDNARRVRSRRLKVSANVTASRVVLVEKVGKLGSARGPEVSANVTALSRRVEALEDCVRSTVAVMVSAKRTDIAPAAGAGS